MPPPVADAPGSACPVAGEAAEDCPWAAIARSLRETERTAPAAEVKTALQARLAALAPELHSQIALAKKIGGDDLRYFDLWGRSSNYDASQLAKPRPAPTVDEPILDAINDLAGVPDARHGAITFAGIEHTYGYLLSLLSTPFGFKRARWVKDDIEAGFGLKRGTLGPRPPAGSFFANVTYLAGRVAFGGNAQGRERAALEAGASAVASELRALDASSLSPLRVEETLALAGDRTVVLRTDFVAFTARKRAPDGNTNLLVYSVYDSREGRSRLITAFPVNDAARAGAVDPAHLGEGHTITTQFNAFVEGVTNSATPLLGARHVL
jgi:hypothetical protein